MGLFGQIVKTVVNVACLPVDAAIDVLAFGADASQDKKFAHRTRDRIKQIKDDVED